MPAIDTYNFSGKKAIIRVDFNVPLNDQFEITDDTRIVAALPTIKKVLADGGAVILMSHLGRPKGEVQDKFSLKHVVAHLSAKLGLDVKMAPDCVGAEVKAMADDMKMGEVMLLENLRFHNEETKGDEGFSKQLAELADVYVNDAFGTAHRAHASTTIIAKFFNEKMAGYLLDKEIKFLGETVANPVKPFVAIVGGAKVSGKLEVLKSLLEKVDTILIGGGMAYTFLKAQGHGIGGSLVEEDLIDTAKQILADAKAKGVNFMLPVDNLAADKFADDADIQEVGVEIPEGRMALDVGPKTVEAYAAEIAKAKTVVWNGPMGCFEMPNFSKGTFGVCEAVAASDCISIIGGGDSVSAVNKSGLADKMSHISTGGGASLEYLEGKVLPGVQAVTE
ncbi:phosphoglycerate kinase [Saccharicrinis fermentans]|uniref:Phosphoglycerate kinase n=1 Tax=Saccharicrinis fermentans DSM 9555 = JCM 21142 TaxID=869213 RepID=W7YC42_9BACT|nr:phosphoglycerate kinase [Saccharicrinis fermentans]GAF02051.1 phosphoglycerate kinase [Saccharicrinis fermentans DSM 9555 = JCM 21142]